MATYGNLLIVAESRRADVIGALTRSAARQPSTLAELGGLIEVLIRYTDHTATGFGLADEQDQGVRTAALRAGDLLRQARAAIGRPDPTGSHATELGRHLHASTAALGAGLDLLNSHGARPDQPRPTPGRDATTIRTTATARSLLHVVAQHTAAAGHVALTASDLAPGAGIALLQAATACAIIGSDGPAPVRAVMLARTPERIPPTATEQLADVAAAIGVSAQRLTHTDEAASVTTWRYLATAAAISCDLAVLMTRRLAERLRELDHHDLAAPWSASAENILLLSNRWKTVTRAWSKAIAAPGPANTALAVDAGDVVVRLGRLAYGDPTWTPGPRRTSLPAPLDQFAPDVADTITLTVVALNAVEACHNIAGHARAAVADMARAHSLHPDRRPWPRRSPKPVRELSTKYEATQSQSRKTVHALHQALQAAASFFPEAAEHAALVLARTAPSPAGGPSSVPEEASRVADIASAAFPGSRRDQRHRSARGREITGSALSDNQPARHPPER